MESTPLKTRPEIRLATEIETESFYGQKPKPGTIAYAACLDGRIIALGGIYEKEGQIVAFCDFKPEMKNHKRTIIEGMRVFVREFGHLQSTALADKNVSSAERFLTHLGFTQYAETEHGKSFGRGI